MSGFLDKIPWTAVIAGAIGGLLSGTLFSALLQHSRWLRERRDRTNAEKDLVFEGRVYWKKKADGSKEGPFCPRCLGDGKRVRLQENYNYCRWYCLTCRTCIGEAEKKEKSLPPGVIRRKLK